MPQFEGVGRAGVPDAAAPGRDAMERVQQRAEEVRQAGEEAAASAGDAGRRMQNEPVHRENMTMTDNRTPETRAAERENLPGQGEPKNIGTTNVNQVQKNVVEGVNLPSAATGENRSKETQQGIDPSLLTPGHHDATGGLMTILPMVILAGVIVGVLWQKFIGKRKAGNAFPEGFGSTAFPASTAPAPTNRRQADDRQGDGAALLQEIKRAMQTKETASEILRTTPYADPATIPKTPRRHRRPLTLADRMHALAEATKDAALRIEPVANRAASPVDSYRAAQSSPTSRSAPISPDVGRVQGAASSPKGEGDEEPPAKRFEIRV